MIFFIYSNIKKDILRSKLNLIKTKNLGYMHLSYHFIWMAVNLNTTYTRFSQISDIVYRFFFTFFGTPWKQQDKAKKITKSWSIKVSWLNSEFLKVGWPLQVLITQMKCKCYTFFTTTLQGSLERGKECFVGKMFNIFLIFSIAERVVI